MIGIALCQGLAPRSAFANLHATLLVLNHPPQGRITLDQAGRRSNGLPRFRRNPPDHSVLMTQGHQSLFSPGLIAAIRNSRCSSLRQNPTLLLIPAARTGLNSILSGALHSLPTFTGFAAKSYRHWIARVANSGTTPCRYRLRQPPAFVSFAESFLTASPAYPKIFESSFACQVRSDLRLSPQIASSFSGRTMHSHF